MKRCRQLLVILLTICMLITPYGGSAFAQSEPISNGYGSGTSVSDSLNPDTLKSEALASQTEANDTSEAHETSDALDDVISAEGGSGESENMTSTDNINEAQPSDSSKQEASAVNETGISDNSADDPMTADPEGNSDVDTEGGSSDIKDDASEAASENDTLNPVTAEKASGKDAGTQAEITNADNDAIEDPSEEAADEPEDVQEDPEGEPEDGEEPEEPEESDTDISGDVSGANGWIWKLKGISGKYTLTFEYTGDADTAPAFEVPNSFISNISDKLGDVSKNDIKKIVIPERCTRIGTYAFQNMDGIEKVEIASTVKTIDNTAFGDNNNDNDAPLGCGNLREVVIKTNSEGVSELEYIGARAFNGCKALTKMDLSKTKLRRIDYGGLMNTGLEEIYIPDSIALSTAGYSSSNSSYYIGQYAFARNPKLKKISLPAFFYIPNSVQSYTLSYCPSLEEVDFREVEGARTNRYYNWSQLPDYIFQGDYNLKTIDLSAWQESTYSSSFTITQYTFGPYSGNEVNTLSDIEKIILPSNKSIAISGNAFRNRSGIYSWSQFVNHEAITSIGDYAFQGTRFVSCDMSDMTKLTAIGTEAFKNCDNMTGLVLPENVTTIGSGAFKSCDNLETVRIEAKNLTSVSTSNLFQGDDKLKTVSISSNTVKLNGNVLASIPKGADTLFEGENIIEITKATAAGGSNPLKNLNGKFYVDPKGVLYKLDEEGAKASVAYVPPGIETYTVPETITAPGGKEYTVNGINEYALNLADDLADITFEAPEKVYLKTSAFTGWSKSNDNLDKTVNGKTVIAKEDWLKVSTLCDFPIEEEGEKLVPVIENVITNSDGDKELSVLVSVKYKNPSDDGTYEYLTGQNATYTIAISNGDNLMDKVVRVYFSYSDNGYNMGSFTVGERKIKNTQGNEYPIKVVQTENPNIYYYELTGLLPGDTLAFTNDILYPSKTTGGGEVKIWSHTLSSEEAKATEGEVINPIEYIELDWDTNPVEFTYSKSNSTVYNSESATLQKPIIKTDSSGDAYVSSLAYIISEANKGSASTSEGLDYIRWVNYEDEITLPEELYWREEVLDAVRNGKWQIEDANTYYDYNYNSTIGCKALTVTVSGQKYYLAYLGTRAGYGYSSIENFRPRVTDDGKIKFTWKVANSSLNASGSSASNEYTVHRFYLRIGESVLMADLDKVNDLLDKNPESELTDLLKIHNYSDETRHYSYSDVQKAAADVDTPVDADYNVLITKQYQNYSTSNSSISAGKDDFFDITINNTGILNLNNWGKPVVAEDGSKSYDGNIAIDNLSNWFYIEPANIEKMLNETAVLGTGKNAQTVQLGDWLTLKITKASTFTEEQYQVVDGTEQNNKYTTGTNSNISYGNDNGIRVLEKAAMTFTRTPEGTIRVALEGDDEEKGYNGTYTIGAGGDYPTVKEFFDKIGYMPTYNTAYSLSYDLDDGEEFTLKAGQKLIIPVRSTYKTTPMMLQSDQRNYYNSYSTAVHNYATVNLQVGKEDVSRTVHPFYQSSQIYHYWYRELFLYKYGYIEGSTASLNSTSLIEDNTVIDNQLRFYNYSQKAYDHMQVSDYMDGAQVALAPVAQNEGLTGPNGEELEIYTSPKGIKYYVLNIEGEYKGVVYGSTTGKDSTQNLKADITVSRTVTNGKATSLNTLFKWEPFDNWGGTTSTSYIYYKVLVSASLSGLVSDLAPGETERFVLNNKAWLGDHQGHRLWDTMGMYSQVYMFNKYIITEDGKKDGTDTVDDGTLVKFSRLRHSDKVTYQIEINNITDAPAVLNGSRIRDVLPKNYGKFDWEKGVNVTNLRYYGSDGLTIKCGTGDDAKDVSVSGEVDPDIDDYWKIENTSTSGLQQIRWDSDFKVYFPNYGKLKILVDLEFPERPEDGASIWDQYVAANAGASLENRFYLDSRNAYVEHLLESEGKAVLYKGVYDTGVTTRRDGNSSTTYGTYRSNNTRLLYENGTGNVTYNDPDLKASIVTYYTVLYNGSYDRLYLSDLQDQLPRGFTFNSMCNTARDYGTTSSSERYTYINAATGSTSYRNYTNTSSTAYSSNNYVGYTAPNGRYTSESLSEGYNTNSLKLVTIDNKADEYDSNTVKYINARIVAATSNGSDGRQHITFSITGSPSNANGSGGIIKYDSEVKKYYLNPGEAIRFGYNVLVDKYTETDDLATNTITMPYFDYYNTGFNNAKDLGTVQKAREVSGITANDGTCTMMTATEVADQFGVNVSKYSDPAYSTLEGGNYMVSSVSLERAPITPGIQKTIGGLTVRADNPGQTTIEGSTGGSYGSAYQGGAKSSDIVNWKIRVFNEAPGRNEEASGMMTDYTLVDTMDYPCSFTGTVFYSLYRAGTSSGTKVGSTQSLFTVASRKPDDKEVRISSGNSLTSSGYRNVKIGNAEDDSDDDWFTFGTGIRSGKVKIERDSEGQETMTIAMKGSGFSIPSGYWMDFCIHTMYPSNDTIISETKYNDVILYPEQGYESGNVAQGRARTKQEYDSDGNLVTKNDGIQSGASITITQGYTTSAWKKITEIGDPSNTARSDEPNNYINLSEKTKNFRYDLYVIGPQDVTSRIVIIDDLPHENDHSAFIVKDKRYSDFSVGFLEDDLKLEVAIAKQEGGVETILTEDQYEAYVSDKTEFNNSSGTSAEAIAANDWIGNGTGWTLINGMSGKELEELLKTSRSIRVVIKDENAWQSKDTSKYLIPAKAQIHISFNARINDDEAKPGEIAWNSFGYKYQVPQTYNGSESNSFAISLDAQPLNVGVRYPSAPVLTKNLVEEAAETVAKVDEETGEPILDDSGDPVTEEVTVQVPHKATQDLDFRFIIYEGEPIDSLNDALNMTDEEVAAALEEHNREYVYIPYTVKEGEATHEEGLWTIDYLSAYDSSTGGFKNTEDLWHWTNAGKYTLLELSYGKYTYELDKLIIGANTYEGNNKLFTNSNSVKLQLTADNLYTPEYTDVKGIKVWDDKDDGYEKRPESITVNLLKNDEVADTRVVTEKDDWSFSFEHLLKIEEDGTVNEYFIEEEEVPWYDTEIENSDGQYTITNTCNYKAENEIELKVMKNFEGREWRDGDTFSFKLTAIDGSPMPLDATTESMKTDNQKPEDADDPSDSGSPEKDDKLDNDANTTGTNEDPASDNDTNSTSDPADTSQKTDPGSTETGDNETNEEQLAKKIKINGETEDLTEGFGKIRYTKEDLITDGKYVNEKLFEYEISEVIPDEKIPSVEYDENVYLVTVKVTDNKDGTLNTEISYSVKNSEEEPDLVTLGEETILRITNICKATDLTIVKKMPERADTSSKGANATVVFKVEGKDKDGNIVYENTAGVTFDTESGDSESVTIKEVPICQEITVTEIYSGNYKPKAGSVTRTELVESDDGKLIWQFEFENEYSEHNYTGGIINVYKVDEDGTHFSGTEHE